MEDLQQDLQHLLTAHFVAWLPNVLAALALFVFFAVLARLARFGVHRVTFVSRLRRTPQPSSS